MEENEIHFRHLIPLRFPERKKKVVQTAKHLCAVNGDGVMAESTVSKWFARFKIRNL